MVLPSWAIPSALAKYQIVLANDKIDLPARRNVCRIRAGIYTWSIVQITKTILNKKFGPAKGNELWNHARGIDLTNPFKFNHEKIKGLSHGITLLRDYNVNNKTEIFVPMLELCEEVARRARAARVAGRTVSLSIGYSNMEHYAGRGFSCSRALEKPTNITLDLFNVCKSLFREHYNGSIIRSIHIALSNLSSDKYVQMELFNNNLKKRELGYAMDRIRNKFGSASLLRASSYTKAGVMLDRANKIGGHWA